MRHFFILLFFLFSGVQAWAQPMSKYQARLYSLKSQKSKIKNLKWVKRLLPVSKEKDGKFQAFVVLKGKFIKPGWSLRSSGLRIKKTKTGALLTLVPVDKERTDISFTAFGPGGVKERGTFVIHFPDYAKFRKEIREVSRDKARIMAKRKRELERKKQELAQKKEELARKQEAEEEELLANQDEEDLEELKDEFKLEEKEESISEDKSIAGKRHHISIGADIGTLSVSDTIASDYSSLSADIKGAYFFQINPKWRAGGMISRTISNLSSEGGIPIGSTIIQEGANAVTFLGLNILVGRQIWDSGPLSIYAYLGYYSLSMDVDEKAYGVDSLSGFQLQLRGDYQLLMNKKLSGYLKLAPVASGDSGTSFSNREFALGGGYHFAPNQAGRVWSIDLGISGLSFSSDLISTRVVEFSVSRLIGGVSLHF